MSIVVNVTNTVTEILLETSPGVGGIIGSDLDPETITVTNVGISMINGAHVVEQPMWARFETVALPPSGGRVRVLLKPYVRPLDVAAAHVDTFEILATLSDGTNAPVVGRWQVSVNRDALKPSDTPVLIAQWTEPDTIEWTISAPDASDEIALAELRFGTAQGGPYPVSVLHNVVGTGAQVIQTTGHTPGQVVYGRVAYRNDYGDTAQSNEASAGFLAAPAILSVDPTTTTLEVTLSAVTGASGYVVRYSTTQGGPYTSEVAGAGTTILIGGLTAGTTYYLVAVATAPGIESAQSAEASEDTLGGEPPDPDPEPNHLLTDLGGLATSVWPTLPAPETVVTDVGEITVTVLLD
jgi:hypothetical protein